MIELATPETAQYVADNLGADEICVLDYGRDNARNIAFECARDSMLSWALFNRQGVPCCLFGADGAEHDAWGSAWMFSTDAIGDSGLELVRGARKAVEFSRQFWPQLRIYGEERSPKQTRFLELIGFRPIAEGETELVL